MVSTPLVGKTLFGINLENFKDTFWEIRRSISKRVLILEFQKTQLIYTEVKISNESVERAENDAICRIKIAEESANRAEKNSKLSIRISDSEVKE